MKLIFTLLFSLPLFASAQIRAFDSTEFTFAHGDSLTRHLYTGMSMTGISTITIEIDSPLWQIGQTIKPIFSNGITASTGLMTDTTHPYPSNANSYFLLKMDHVVPNFLINIWHRYQADSLHAGGMVEFSTDTGHTWMNVANCMAVYKTNFYTSSDTLLSGDAVFKGTSNGEILSQFGITNCWGERTTATTCMTENSAWEGVPYYIRFRFISDSTSDSLPGWKIDSIHVIDLGCSPGAVEEVAKPDNIHILPNPATNEITISSVQAIQNITIANNIGQILIRRSCNTRKETVNIANLPKGIYLLRINSTEVRQFTKE